MKTPKKNTLLVGAAALVSTVALLSHFSRAQPQPPKPPVPPVVAPVPPPPSPVGVVAPPSGGAKAILGRAGAAIALNQAPSLHSFADQNGKMFGVGANVVAQIDENGKVVKTFRTAVARGSISPHGADALVLGDLNAKSVSTLDTKSGEVRPLFKLADIKDGALDKFPDGGVIQRGALSSVASDGKNIFVAIEAGFSSAIFKVDPGSQQVVERAWATATDPQAMTYQNGALFVLVDGGSKVRRFTGALERSRESIELPSAGATGIGVRKGEIRGLGSGKTDIFRLAIDDAQLSTSTITSTIDRPTISAERLVTIVFPPLNLMKRYAVLITGDLAENFAGECFWNDTVWMYKSLLANGYTEADIFVLYGDGADFISANAAYRHPTRVTDFAATVANVNMVFDGLKNGDAAHGIPKMDNNDTLFVWTFDHGGTSGGESTLCLRGGSMKASAFAAKINAITYAQRAVFMQQCHSGGFIDPLKNAKSFISTACRADEVARPADTENEVVGGKSYSHGEFNYHITTALNRLKTTPPGGVINADANADGFVSSLEMHSWNVGHESRPETPQSNDMGGIGSTFRFKK